MRPTKIKKKLEFNTQLTKNQYINFSTLYVCLLIKIETNNENDIAAGKTSVNNFFGHWIKEINMKRYGNDIPIQPLKTVKIYRYLDAMLQNVPKKVLKTIDDDLLFSKKQIILTGNRDARLHAVNKKNDTSNNNRKERLTKFQKIIKNNNVYRSPLRYLTHLGLVNFSVKIQHQTCFQA